MSKSEKTESALPQGINLEAWGKSVLEEVLFRAGLEQTSANSTIDQVTVSLEFNIRAMEAEGALHLELERIGSSPVGLQVPLDTSGSSKNNGV
jgi:hypothetical protein